MKFVVTLSFLLISASLFGQDSTSTDSTNQEEILIAGPVNVMRLHETFFPKETIMELTSWDNFEFFLFNRWGEILAESDRPDLILEDCLNIKENQLKIEVYVWMIKGIKGGQEQKMQGHINYLGHCH